MLALWFRFARDSPLEGAGFELSVPGTKEPVFVAEGELRDRTGGSQKGLFLTRDRWFESGSLQRRVSGASLSAELSQPTRWDYARCGAGTAGRRIAAPRQVERKNRHERTRGCADYRRRRVGCRHGVESRRDQDAHPLP